MWRLWRGGRWSLRGVGAVVRESEYVHIHDYDTREVTFVQHHTIVIGRLVTRCMIVCNVGEDVVGVDARLAISLRVVRVLSVLQGLQVVFIRMMGRESDCKWTNGSSVGSIIKICTWRDDNVRNTVNISCTLTRVIIVFNRLDRWECTCGFWEEGECVKVLDWDHCTRISGLTEQEYSWRIESFLEVDMNFLYTFLFSESGVVVWDGMGEQFLENRKGVVGVRVMVYKLGRVREIKGSGRRNGMYCGLVQVLKDMGDSVRCGMGEKEFIDGLYDGVGVGGGGLRQGWGRSLLLSHTGDIHIWGCLDFVEWEEFGARGGQWLGVRWYGVVGYGENRWEWCKCLLFINWGIKEDGGGIFGEEWGEGVRNKEILGLDLVGVLWLVDVGVLVVWWWMDGVGEYCGLE
ncbi:hypothetical protein Tco_1112873 [Tanacetum coccineum]|uniref:Uncharacterized protein n=1 Tax=Tanacetum coccineum TaxID=301880 RepID=A0ABQ5IQJ4_9ASTR